MKLTKAEAKRYIARAVQSLYKEQYASQSYVSCCKRVDRLRPEVWDEKPKVWDEAMRSVEKDMYKLDKLIDPKGLKVEAPIF